MSKKPKHPEVVEDQDLDQVCGGSSPYAERFAGGVYVSSADVGGSATLQAKIATNAIGVGELKSGDGSV